jgi:tetratricopeptide (TPR) repeat protein
MGYTSWIASRPEDARKAVQSVLPWLETALRRAPRSSQERSVRRSLARGHELLGALALDALQNDLAQAHFRSALTVSEELGDDDLIAAHMTQLGDAYRRQGDKETALDLMNAALGRAQHAERATRGYIEEMIAYTYSDVGDLLGFERHIGEAVHLLGHSGEGEGAAQREFIPFEVLEISGKAMRDFGKPQQALDYLERAEAALLSRPNVPRWHAVLTISKAQALCDGGELEAGVELAIRGITLAHSCQSPRQMNRVRKLMRKLDESSVAGAPAVAPLREIVRDIYAGNRNPLQWHPVHSL